MNEQFFLGDNPAAIRRFTIIAFTSSPHCPMRNAVVGLDHNPLHLIERDLIARPVIELCRPRGLVRRNQLCVLDRAAIL